jgi:hypothetical protein
MHPVLSLPVSGGCGRQFWQVENTVLWVAFSDFYLLDCGLEQFSGKRQCILQRRSRARPNDCFVVKFLQEEYRIWYKRGDTSGGKKKKLKKKIGNRRISRDVCAWEKENEKLYDELGFCFCFDCGFGEIRA